MIGDPDYAERWRSRSQLGFTPMVSSPWRFQARLIELWDEGDCELIGGRSWDDLALESLAAALDELEERYGTRPSRPGPGAACTGSRFTHPLGEGDTRASKLLDRLLSRRLPAGGGQETVCQVGFVPHAGDYTGRWAPSYRLLADLGSPERSRWQHMTGQSGQPASPHYDDLLEDWHAGRSYEFGQAGRPDAPSRSRIGFEVSMPSRRDQIAMSDDELRAFVAEQMIVSVATAGPRGRPHLVPLWYVADGIVLRSWTYAKSQKAKNLERDPRATLQVEDGVLYHELRGVMLECDVGRRARPGRGREVRPRPVRALRAR